MSTSLCKTTPVVDASVNATGAYLYQECPRKYLFRERYKLRRKGAYASPLAIGGFFHKMLETFVLGGDLAKCKETLTACVEKEEARIRNDIRDDGTLPGNREPEHILSQAKKDADLALCMFEVLSTFYWDALVKILAEWKVLPHLLEKPLTAGRLKGRIDLPLVHRTKKGLGTFLDFKTTSRDPKILAATLKWDVQPVIYRKLLEKNAGLQVKYAYHLIVRKPTLRLSAADRKFADPWAAYLKRVRKNFYEAGFEAAASDPTIGPPILVSRIEIPDDDDLNAILVATENAASVYPSLVGFPRNKNACYGYNSRCPYFELCERPPGLWPNEVRQNYRQELTHD